MTFLLESDRNPTGPTLESAGFPVRAMQSTENRGQGPAQPSMTLTGPRANQRPVDNPTADAITVMDALRVALGGEPR